MAVPREVNTDHVSGHAPGQQKADASFFLPAAVLVRLLCAPPLTIDMRSG